MNMEVTLNSPSNTNTQTKQLIADNGQDDNNLQSSQKSHPILNAKTITNLNTNSSNFNNKSIANSNIVRNSNSDSLNNINNNNNNHNILLNESLISPIIQSEGNITIIDRTSNQENKHAYKPANSEEIRDIIQQLINKVINTEISSSNQRGLDAPANSLNRQTSMHDSDSNAKQPSPSLSPDDLTCDLVIDSELPSDEAQENSLHTEQSEAHFKVLVNHGKGDESDEELPELAINDVVPMNDAKTTISVQNTQQQALLKTEVSSQATKEAKSKDKSDELTPDPFEEKILTDLTSVKGKKPNVTKLEHDSDNQHDEFLGSEPSNDERHQDIITLKNLEITPPRPLSVEDEKAHTNETDSTPISSRRGSKRGRAQEQVSTPDLNESSESSCRSKRLRTQTKLFQVGSLEYPSIVSPTTPSTSSTKKSTKAPSNSSTARERKRASTVSNVEKDIQKPQPQQSIIQQSTSSPQNVIFYEKNDYLAIRNEEDSFYLCQLTENVRVNRPMIRVRWLDTKDDKTYFLTSLYDQVPQLSILMPVSLNKIKGDQIFNLSDQDRDNIMDRLKRSLNAVSAVSGQGSHQ